jgi:hypothetical protein
VEGLIDKRFPSFAVPKFALWVSTGHLIKSHRVL